MGRRMRPHLPHHTHDLVHDRLEGLECHVRVLPLHEVVRDPLHRQLVELEAVARQPAGADDLSDGAPIMLRAATPVALHVALAMREHEHEH